MVDTKTLTAADVAALLSIDESYFCDLKAREIKPAKLSKFISGFANASGGEIYVGIEEHLGTSGKTRVWSGFSDPEEANDIFGVISDIDPLRNSISAQFLKSDAANGLVLQLTISKTQNIVTATDGTAFVRVNASCIPVKDQALERLRYDKGIKSYEDELLNVNADEISNSQVIIEFLMDTVPTGEPVEWLEKQFVLINGRPTVAGILLYSDAPQALLPKRSAVKILQYRTKAGAERDFLASTPETIEGPIYSLIYNAVDRVKEIIEGIEKVGSSGMETVSYPHEALHELLTNAILHRDYSVAADVQVRIFDNRVEIESPGRFPGHVTIANITKTQFARNPKIVRLINKFNDPPNKDVGEGINTAFEAMEKIRLKRPEFSEVENSVVVTLRHESLDSPEQIVMQYLGDHDEITNQIARDLTGIKSENTMKNVFYRLRDAGELEQVPKVAGKRHAWRKKGAAC